MRVSQSLSQAVGQSMSQSVSLVVELGASLRGHTGKSYHDSLHLCAVATPGVADRQQPWAAPPRAPAVVRTLVTDAPATHSSEDEVVGWVTRED